MTIDQDGAIESLNPTAEHFFGLAAGEMEGRSLKGLLFEADHPRIEAYLAGVRRQRGEDFSLETRGRRRDGSAFFIDLFISDLFPHRHYRFIVTIHNISKRKAAEDRLRQALEEQEERIRERTAELQASNRQLHHEIVERKRAEAVLRETQNELIQASKLAALGQMSAGLTHELNQPLTALRTFCASGKLLLQRGLHAQVEENFGQIQELTERMAKLTSQLKTFARKSRGEILRVPVRLAIEQSFDLLANRIAQEEVEVVLNLPGAEVQLLGDQVRLEQVVINLVSNAIDAMAGRAERRLAVDYRLTPKYLWLTFTDSGGGIPAEILPQIFDPFFTTKEVGEGLGLGLSIAYGIVKDWGGSLQAKNVEGGAEFTIKLPRFTGTGEKAP